MVAMLVMVGLVCLCLIGLNGGFGGNGRMGLTQVAGTRIQTLVPPLPGAMTRLSRMIYTPVTTAQVLTFLRPFGRTTVNGAAAAGQAVVNLTADPGVTPQNTLTPSNPIAANDLIAIREKDGITRFYKVSSVATLAITLTGNLVAGCLGGEKVWDFGIVSDTGEDGQPHQNINSGTAALTLQDSDSGVLASLTQDDPILFDSPNATTAGTLTQLNWSYTLR